MIHFDENQIFIVTGISSGIGKQVGLLLNQLGAKVVGIDRNENSFSEVLSLAKNKDLMFFEKRDFLENTEELTDFVKSLKEKYGKFHGLVCCAGIDEIVTLRNLDASHTDKIFKINYLAPLMLVKGFADKRNNDGEGAGIVLIASIAATNPEKGQITYAGTKAALLASAQSISKELAPSKIRINCVSPAPVNTPLLADNPYKEELFSRCKLGVIDPMDVANMVAYLLSDLSLKITGRNFVIDGGYL